MIRWTCRQCGETLEAPESIGGDVIECARCGLSQPVGGAVAPALVAALSKPPERSVDDGILTEKRRVEMQRISTRPELRAAIRQTAWGLLLWVLLSVLLSVIGLAKVGMTADDPRIQRIEIIFAVVGVGWLLGLAWFIGGIIRALLAASKMI